MYPLMQVLIGVGHATQLGIDSPKAGLHIITLASNSSIFFVSDNWARGSVKKKVVRVDAYQNTNEV